MFLRSAAVLPMDFLNALNSFLAWLGEVQSVPLSSLAAYRVSAPWGLLFPHAARDMRDSLETWTDLFVVEEGRAYQGEGLVVRIKADVLIPGRPYVLGCNTIPTPSGGNTSAAQSE